MLQRSLNKRSRCSAIAKTEEHVRIVTDKVPVEYCVCNSQRQDSRALSFDVPAGMT